MTKQWVRREPPRFLAVEVASVATRSPHLLRVTFTGAELRDMEASLPAASVRLLVPSRGTEALVVPTWNGNEFLLPDGSRPTIRTYTPLNHDTGADRLDLDVVLHDAGAVAAWARRAAPGDPAAISGPGRGFAIDPAVTSYVLAGDESALPAIGQLLEHLPARAEVQVLAEVSNPDARIELPAHRGATITWLDLPPGGVAGDAVVAAVVAAEIPADAHVWAAGEAAAVQRIRKHLFDERGIGRSQATVRGYWKHGRVGD